MKNKLGCEKQTGRRPARADRNPNPLSYALAFAGAGLVWIIVSDWLLGGLVSDPVRLSRIQTYKGLLFVSAGALLLYFLLVRHNRRVNRHISRISSAREAFIREADLKNAVMETSPVGIVVQAPDGGIEYANRRAEEILGSGLVLGSGRVGNDNYGLSADLFPFRRIAAEGAPVLGERITLRDGNGLPMHLSVNSAPLFDPDLKISNIVTTFEDVSGLISRERELTRVNRTLRAISECNKAVLLAGDEPRLLEEICRIVVENGGYSLCWVGLARPDHDCTVEPVAGYGDHIDYLNDIKITWIDDEWGRGPTGQAIRTGEYAVFRNLDENESYGPWRREASRHGFASSLSLPLIVNEDVIGALNIYSSGAGSFPDDEIGLLREMAANLTQGMEKIRARQGRIRAIRRLMGLRTLDQAVLASEHIEAIVEKALEYFLELAREQDYGLLALFGEDRLKIHLLIRGKSLRTFLLPGADLSDFSAENLGRPAEAEWLERLMSSNSELIELLGEEKPKRWGVPLISGRGIIGVLLARAGNEGHLSEEQMEPALDAAGELSLALEQDRLKQIVARHAGELEMKVAERTRALEEVNDELNSFAYSVSHDLRAPLRGLEGFTSALLEDYGSRLDATGREYCRYIIESCRLMDELIKDVLNYSRLARTEIMVQPLDLEQLVREAVLRMETDLAEAELRLDLKPGLLINAHKPTFIQVMLNLLSNAVKFVPPGRPPAIDVTSEIIDDYIRLWIRDNGIGVDPEHQERIFRVFERLHGGEEYPGSGIGLAIVRKAVLRMGGRVGVESALDRGSGFWIELPAVGIRE